MEESKHSKLLNIVKNNFNEIIKSLKPDTYVLTKECLCCDSFNTNIKDNRYGYRCHAGNCIAIHHPEIFKVLESKFEFLTLKNS